MEHIYIIKWMYDNYTKFIVSSLGMDVKITLDFTLTT
jgi:hypothetical protein